MLDGTSTEVLRRLAAYHLQPLLLRGLLDSPPMVVVSVPNALTVVWSAGFLIAVLVLGRRSSARRTL